MVMYCMLLHIITSDKVGTISIIIHCTSILVSRFKLVVLNK